MKNTIIKNTGGAKMFSSRPNAFLCHVKDARHKGIINSKSNNLYLKNHRYHV